MFLLAQSSLSSTDYESNACIVGFQCGFHVVVLGEDFSRRFFHLHSRSQVVQPGSTETCSAPDTADVF